MQSFGIESKESNSLVKANFIHALFICVLETTMKKGIAITVVANTPQKSHFFKPIEHFLRTHETVQQ